MLQSQQKWNPGVIFKCDSKKMLFENKTISYLFCSTIMILQGLHLCFDSMKIICST